MTTHVKVSRAVHDMLKEKKDELGLRSVDAVVQHFLAGSQDEGEEDSPSSSEGDDSGELVKRRRIDVREALYSLEILDERPGMLEYYTGFDRPAVDLLIRRFSEVIESEAPDRRQSNDGFRKLDLADRVVMFLTRLRRKVTFQELGYQYGCGKESARRYCKELTNLFHEHFVPQLVFPRPPEELSKMTRNEVRQRFPDLLAILDATNWEQFKPENFLENRLSYSAYKHTNVYQVLLVVSTERLILWRSEIFGGISNEISVLLDESTLPQDMKAKGYLAKREADPAAVVCLGDSAYHRSSVKGELGLGLPVPQRNDGVQQKGEDVAKSHKVQSVRAVVEQTIADLKLAKVMEGNKIKSVSKFEKVLDCVIGLHNLRVLLKVNPQFDIPTRRAAIRGEHIFKPLVPENEVDLKIPADAPDLSLKKYRPLSKFKDFLPSAAKAIENALELQGKECVFYPTVRKRGENLYKGAYVLQLRVQEEVLGTWTVKYLVGASYSYETHTGYFQMSRDNAVVGNICDCFSGARPCSHLFAVLRLLVDFNDPKVNTLLRVRAAPMPKPDKVLRFRPLKEVEHAVSKLKRVVLFHPKPIVEELPAQYCVCKKGERKTGKRSKDMLQCDGCWDWFHFDCVGIKRRAEVAGKVWTCEWCRDPIDKQGYQRWKTGRKKPKKRHQRDTPRLSGAVLGGDPPPRYSAPPTWDGKVAQVRELARRAAVKKRKLTEAVEQLVAEGGHHLVDAEGMAGLELRPVDEGVIDEMVGAGIVDEEEFDESD